jgi:AcrR family transcriptional regulator
VRQFVGMHSSRFHLRVNRHETPRGAVVVQSRSHLETTTVVVRPRPVEHEPTERPRPGRPRDERVHQTILDTTLAMLSEIGYGRLTIEGVAARAGVGKGTIYRHWPSKGALVVEAISGPHCPIATGKWTIRLGELPDGGCLRADLMCFVQRVGYAFTVPLAAETLPGLALDLARDESLAEAFRSFVVQPKRERLADVVELARGRGELDGDVDVTLLSDLLVGPLLYRAFLTGGPLDEAAAATLVDTVMLTLPVLAR